MMKNYRKRLLLSSAAIILLCAILPCLVTSGITAEEDTLSKEETISLELKNIEVVELLRIFSLKTGKTIVPTQSITGRITLFLNNVSFKDALDIILLTQGFALEKRENIYYVMTNAEYKAKFGKEYMELRDLKTIKLKYAKPANVFNALSQLKSEIGSVIADEASGTVILIDLPEKIEIMEDAAKEIDQPLQTLVFDLNYSTAENAKTQLSSVITSGTGEVIVDERSSKAIVSDLPQKMDKIRNLVKEIDEETRQVFIEANIVEVTITDKLERGIEWDKLLSYRSKDGLKFTGSFEPQTALTNFQRITVGTLASNYYDVTLDFLQTYGDIKIISQPRIAVVDNEKASFLVGTRKAYVTGTYSQAEGSNIVSEEVEFVDVGVKLDVTPQINKDGFITMKIKPEISSADDTLETSQGSIIPIVDTSEAETTVKIKDGTMIMIAGLRKETYNDEIKGIPLLSRIPFLGAVFSNRTRIKELKEIIIFITPHITRGDTTLPGYEPEKMIPEDVMPQDLKERLVKQEKMGQAITKELITKRPPKVTESEIEPGPKVAKPEPEAIEQVEIIEAQDKRLEFQKSMMIAEAKQVIEAEVTKHLEEIKAQQEEIAARREDHKDKAEDALFIYSNGDVKLFERIKALYRKALEYQNVKEWNKALEYYNKVLDIDSQFVPAYNQQGIVYEARGQINKAEEIYLKAIELNPNYPPAYSNLALLNEERGDTQAAIEYWRKRASLGEPESVWREKASEHIRKLEN